MHSWLVLFIARLFAGEKLEKETPQDWRLEGSFFFAMPVMLWLFTYVGNEYLKHANVGGIFLFVMGFVAISLLTVAVCFKWIPTKLLFFFAVIAWSLIVWRWGFNGINK